MTIESNDFNFVRQPADSFLNDQNPDLRAGFARANTEGESEPRQVLVEAYLVECMLALLENARNKTLLD